MTLVFCLQNLTHIFWTIIVCLNLYVLLLLYRISKQYRAERAMKLLATSSLSQNIELMRCLQQRTLPTPNNIPIVPAQVGEETIGSVCQISEPSDTSSIRQTLPQTIQQMLPSNQCKHKLARPSTNSSRMVNEERPVHAARNPRILQQSQQRPRQDLLMKRNNGRHVKNISSCLSMSTNNSDDSQSYTPHPEDEHILYISDSRGRVVHEIPFRECDYVDALCSVLEDSSLGVESCE